VYEAFVSRLVEATRSLNIGVAEAPSTQIGPVIDANARDRIQEYIATGRQDAEVALEMSAPDTGYFIGPVIFKDVSPMRRLLKKKSLGQLLPSFGRRTSKKHLMLPMAPTTPSQVVCILEHRPTSTKPQQSLKSETFTSTAPRQVQLFLDSPLVALNSLVLDQRQVVPITYCNS
jgi:hypothetical protein